MSLYRTVFGSEFQMAGAVQRNAHFAIVVLVNGWHSAGVADRRRRLWTSSLSWSRPWSPIYYYIGVHE